ncbi:MAG: hypothetical protein JWQ42_742 [Edaphobacter sp.]|nr:hypothetical protein [Edaphobacter sp.]
MRKIAGVCTAAMLSMAVAGFAQQAGPYKLLKTTKVGGEGGFDYVYADSAARKLYVPRSGPSGKIAVFNLDTLKPVGEIDHVSARGVAIDQRSKHGFGSSKPLAMWDARTLATIKTIDVQGGPDGILADEANGRIYVFSHVAPNVTVIEAKDGSVAGTIDLGGAPEQGALDGKGHLYIDLEDKGKIAVVDTKTMTMTGSYDLEGKGGTCAGLAMDVKNNILFATCRNPQTMVILDAANGKILETLPIGGGTDGAVFNPATMEVFSSQGDGTLTIVKESSPTSFAVEQTLTTMPRAKTLTLDKKTNRLYLITAEFGTAPAPEPGQRPVRPPMIPDSFSILEVGK